MRRVHGYSCIIILLWQFSIVSVPAETALGVVAALIGESYGEPVAAVSRDLFAPDPIQKITASLMPQFIWRHQRSMVLLNLELLGALGSNAGSFGSEGHLSGQVKIDTFYRGFFGSSPFYVKFGKYRGDMPFNFGAKIETGQLEAGYDNQLGLKFSYSLAFLSWFKKSDDSGNVTYADERYHDEDQLAHFLSWDQTTDFGLFNGRLALFQESNTLRLFPSLRYRVEQGLFSNDSYVGLGSAIALNQSGQQGWLMAFRQEFGLLFFESVWQNRLLFSFLGAGYERISIDNLDFEAHYGTHFNYLYRQVGNIFGQWGLGYKTELTLPPFYLWGALSFHSTLPDDERMETIGLILSLGGKWNGIFGDDSHIELYASWMIPGSYTTVAGSDMQHGLQIIIKLQQVLF